MFNPRIERLERVLEGVVKVPAPNASDKDKVPMVNADGDYELEDLPKEVPEPAVADEGKVIGVNSSGEYALVDLPNEVPEPSVSDEGKLIGVNSSGEYALVDAPSNAYFVDLASADITIHQVIEADGMILLDGIVSEQVDSDLYTFLTNGKACWINTGEMYYDNDTSSYAIDDSVGVNLIITGIDSEGNYMTPMYYINNQNSKVMAMGYWQLGFSDNTSPINPINA